jgi:hypothetical protein
MTKRTTFWTAGIATLILALVCTGVALLTRPSSNSFTDAAASITFITGAAIAIERIIEVMWTILGGFLGTYWPLNAISRQVNTMVDDLGVALKPFHDGDQLGNILAQTGKLSKEDVVAAEAEITRIKARFDELLKLTPDNQRMQLLAASASQNIAYISKKYGKFAPTLEQAADTAGVAITGLQDFLATFKDNPGRRLISIYTGAVLGLIVAGVFGLDIFQAVLQPTPAQQLAQPITHPFLVGRVILTGLAIGLGSNPTHEIIKAIQVYKEGQKGANILKPSLPPGTFAGGEDENAG